MSRPSFKVKAVYDYSSAHDEDLSFPIEQIISVTEEEDDDWYFGHYTDTAGAKQEGLFPRNFVEKMEPERPPRPTRVNRPKKEPEPDIETEMEPVSARANTEIVHTYKDVEEEPALPAPARKVESSEAVVQSQGPRAVSALPDPSAPVSKPKGAAKSPPPAIAAKPTSGSFKDRIAAFNKTSAPPIAPFKPGGSGSTFIKKPFVAPPPSKDSYVPIPRDPPPQKLYRREEDPNFAAGTDEQAHTERSAPAPVSNLAEDEDQPKPTSLQDRIALLQKQQLEQAARHAEAGQKKEKPKRPVKSRTESSDQLAEVDTDAGELSKLDSADTVGVSPRTPREEIENPVRIMRRKSSRDTHPIPRAPTQDFQSDANDADQSAIDETTEDAGETSAGPDDSDGKFNEKVPPSPLAKTEIPPSNDDDVEDVEDGEGGEEGSEEEEEDVDPEIKRRMEIRERMAKMSGGMGMAGMFGPPGGMPPIPSKKKKGSTDSKPVEEDTEPFAQAPPIAIMPMPGMAQMKSPRPSDLSPLSGPGEEEPPVMAPVIPRRSQEVDSASRVSQERATRQSSVNSSSRSSRGVPPVPSTQSRPLPPPPVVSSTKYESDSDSGTGLAPRNQKETASDEESKQSAVKSPAVPGRPLPAPRKDTKVASESTTVSPVEPSKRSSFVPPIPGTAAATSAQSRAPPPPPPTGPPPTNRVSTGSITSPKLKDDSEEEITEYEGDYDTDIAPGATHKDALKSHAREASFDESTTIDDTPARSPVVSPPRAVPPPPPSQPPRANRPSGEVPRVPPPPPPPARQLSGLSINDDEEYDPYRYAAPGSKAGVPTHATNSKGPLKSYEKEQEVDDLYDVSPKEEKEMKLPPVPSERSAPPPPPSGPPPPKSVSRTQTRQSLDIPSGTNSRRSNDGPRASMEHETMAVDVDFSLSSRWWLQPNIPPPVFQNRRDLSFEVEENTSTQRGGKSTTSKDIYVLFSDYSQTVISARFDPRDSSSAPQISQRHEPPPARLRQDQLEAAHTQFGAQMASAANTSATSKSASALGDGSPLALVTELLKALPAALPPVGTRAFGALVYANLANASVQQFDEIRPGDILTLRNARFQGHRGPMHQKYSIEVGGSGLEHIGVVVDWDGTKKKVRAWEQGRESKGKIKVESWKVGDLKSGEVRVWRVVGRGWVGWEGGS
ncbi:MAG: hypothetical protein M1814_001627 [Vezdaea aestivalis]|nr:MAG: hypothetical protein M1814_001627 [Vezdaea aestivalis]